MFVLHFDGRIQSFPTLRRAVNFREDFSRHAPRPQLSYIVDTKSTANYTTPHPSSKKKPAVFVRANPTLDATDYGKIAKDETFTVRNFESPPDMTVEQILTLANQ